MKHCTKCGKELFDEAVVCPGCGCSTEQPAVKPVSKRFTKKVKIGLIAILAVACCVFSVLAVTTKKSDKYIRSLDEITYYESEYGQMGRSPAEVNDLISSAEKEVEKFETQITVDWVIAALTLIGAAALCFVKTKE